MMIMTIAGRELRSMFLSPLAWAVLAVIGLIMAFLFLQQLDVFIAYQPQIAMMESPLGVTEIVAVPLFSTAAVVLLLVVPLLTMRLISEERRQKTLPLLLSAPISMTEIVLGKYLGIVGFLLLMLLLVTLMPLSLLAGGTLDFGLLSAAVIGLLLMLAAFAAAGLFLSSVTSHPTVAAIATFGLLLLLWIIDMAGGADGGSTTTLLGWLSIQRHYQSLLQGLFDSGDLAYYLIFITLFLVLTIRQLDSDRVQH